MFRSTNCILWLVVFGIGEQMLLEGRFQSGQVFFSGSVENFGRAGAQAPRHSGGQAATWRGDGAAKQEAVRRPGGAGGQAARQPGGQASQPANPARPANPAKPGQLEQAAQASQPIQQACQAREPPTKQAKPSNPVSDPQNLVHV